VFNFPEGYAYCGKIIVVNQRNQHPTIVEGKHVKIISDLTFNEVQKVINRKKNKRHSFINGHSGNEMLPFRGFLYCPICKQKLTGSGSLGKTKRYFYYHCKCGFRIRADKVYQSFLETINVLKPAPEYVHLFRLILEKICKRSTSFESVNQQHTINKIEELRDNMCSARSLLLSKDIDAGDYHKIISDCETKITILKDKLNAALISLAQFKNKLEFMYPKISELQRVFEEADTSKKDRCLPCYFKKI
jgi:site-specific DNA recombinase